MISTEAYMKEVFDQTMALGDKAVSSDSVFVIDGYEGLSILFKQYSWPVLSSQGEIEVPGPLGTKTWQAQQVGTAKQCAITMFETKMGHIQEMQKAILANGGKINGRMYEGTPDNFTRSARIKQAFFVLEDPERDMENRAQLMTITGTMFYHYHGEA